MTDERIGELWNTDLSYFKPNTTTKEPLTKEQLLNLPIGAKFYSSSTLSVIYTVKEKEGNILRLETNYKGKIGKTRLTINKSFNKSGVQSLHASGENYKQIYYEYI